MKKILLILLLVVSTYASIGNITAMKGDIQVNGDKATYQTELEKNDFIKTGKNAKVQIRFNDGTIFTLGKNSTLDIEEFLYDEKQPRLNKAKFNVLKGAFSSITGRIGKLNKSKFKLRTKSASIGIRGTVVRANQEIIMCTSGAITVTTNNGVSMNVNAGQMTNVASGTPSIPTSIEKTEIKELNVQEKSDEVKDQATVSNTVNEAKTWGEWNKEPELVYSTQNIESINKKWSVSGYETNSAYLDNLRNSTNTIKASYTGTVDGDVNGNDLIKQNAYNQVKLNFELGGGRNSLSGTMKFETESGQKWNSIFNGSTFGNGFNSGSVAGTANDRAITDGSVNGKFFGKEAQEAGGTFQLKTGSDTATGVFKASK